MNFPANSQRSNVERYEDGKRKAAESNRPTCACSLRLEACGVRPVGQFPAARDLPQTGQTPFG